MNNIDYLITEKLVKVWDFCQVSVQAHAECYKLVQSMEAPLHR